MSAEQRDPDDMTLQVADRILHCGPHGLAVEVGDELERFYRFGGTEAELRCTKTSGPGGL